MCSIKIFIKYLFLILLIAPSFIVAGTTGKLMGHVTDKETGEPILGANVVITGSTKIIDVSGSQPKEYKGFVPARSVVIPGTIAKKFPAGEYNVPAALIIGKRKPSTDLKTSLNDALREYDVAV